MRLKTATEKMSPNCAWDRPISNIMSFTMGAVPKFSRGMIKAMPNARASITQWYRLFTVATMLLGYGIASGAHFFGSSFFSPASCSRCQR